MTIKFSANMQVVREALVDMGDLYLDSIRPAAQAMAQVYYDALIKSYDAAGIDVVTGNLRGSLYQAFRKEKSDADTSLYAVSWAGRNSRKSSQHAHLVEYGWTQRYQAVKNKRGEWVTAVRPEMRGKPKPRRGDPQSVKDAYFVLRPNGERKHAARPFMRPVVYSEAIAETARQAAIDKIDAILSRT